MNFLFTISFILLGFTLYGGETNVVSRSIKPRDPIETINPISIENVSVNKIELIEPVKAPRIQIFAEKLSKAYSSEIVAIFKEELTKIQTIQIPEILALTLNKIQTAQIPEILALTLNKIQTAQIPEILALTLDKAQTIQIPEILALVPENIIQNNINTISSLLLDKVTQNTDIKYKAEIYTKLVTLVNLSKISPLESIKIRKEWYEKFSVTGGSRMWWILEIAKQRVSVGQSVDDLKEAFDKAMLEWINEPDIEGEEEDL